jgi:3-methyladenine DNA glycosylase AlkD
MPNNYHHDVLLKLIKDNSGKGTQHTLLDSYLGNSHPRYLINAPTLRKIAKDWMRAHRDLSPKEFTVVLTSLVMGESSTEKCLVGMLLDCSIKAQRKFSPKLFSKWLDHLEGWAEVDSVCTGDYTITEIPENWNAWQKIINQFSKSKNINKRRASLVLLCSTLRHVVDKNIAQTALESVDRLKNEKDILITKAISWLLRSMVTHYRPLLVEYLNKNKEQLPKIAVRETMTKLNTGIKTKRKMK